MIWALTEVLATAVDVLYWGGQSSAPLRQHLEEIGDGGEGRRARRARGVYRKLENYYQIHVGLASSLCSETRFFQWSGSLSKSILLFITSPLSVCVCVCACVWERGSCVCARACAYFCLSVSLVVSPAISPFVSFVAAYFSVEIQRLVIVLFPIT